MTLIGMSDELEGSPFLLYPTAAYEQGDTCSARISIDS